MQNFSPILPDETDTFGFDFKNNLGDATITLATVKCSVKPGGLGDAAAATRVGSPQVQLSTVLFPVSGCVDGVDYILEATATLSDGRVLSQWSIVRCRAAPKIQ